MKVAAFGRTKMLLDAVEACIAAGHEITLIGTADPAPEYGAGLEEYERLARRVGCTFFTRRDTPDDEFAKHAREAGADIAISMNWPALVPPAVREAFRFGVLNAHPGDLPRYRGNACPNWAIINGEREVVLTIHEMADGLDDGPVYSKQAFTLSDSTYVGEVYRWLGAAVPDAFVSVLEAIARTEVEPQPQPADPGLALRVYPRLPQDSELRWERPALELARLVRASGEPFAGAFTHLGSDIVRVWRAHSSEFLTPVSGTPGQVTEVRPRTGEVGVLTGDGELVLEEIQIGHERGPAADLVRSGRARFGFDVAAAVARLNDRLDALLQRDT